MEVTCPICNESKNTSIFLKDFKDVTFKTSDDLYDMYECKSCDVKFQHPFIPEEEVGKYYPNEDYHPFKMQQKLFTTEDKYQPQSIYLRLLKEKYNREDKFSLIDVGSGGGTFLRSVKHNFPNAELLGVDVSQVAIDNLKSDNIEGVCSSLYDFKIDKKFDVVVSSQVLEHLNHPYKYLEVLSSLAKDDSLIMIDVPATDSYSAKKYKENWVHWDMPRHSIMYSQKSLSKLIENYFDTLSMRHAGSTRAILSSKKLSNNEDIYHPTFVEKVTNKLQNYIGKAFSIDKWFSDKIVWVGKLK